MSHRTDYEKKTGREALGCDEDGPFPNRLYSLWLESLLSESQQRVRELETERLMFYSKGKIEALEQVVGYYDGKDRGIMDYCEAFIKRIKADKILEPAKGDDT